MYNVCRKWVCAECGCAAVTVCVVLWCRLVVWGVLWVVERVWGVSVTASGWRIMGVNTLSLRSKTFELVGVAVGVAVGWVKYKHVHVHCLRPYSMLCSVFKVM